MREITKEWIIKAESDFHCAQVLFTTQPPEYDDTCFHSQQCIEKYLKAVLQENNIFFEKNHDLIQLLKECVHLVPSLQDHKDEIARLSEYAVSVRYPGFGTTKNIAQEAISTTQNIREIIRNYFHLSQNLK